MKVSCYCSTYNRPSRYQVLLEEAVESFLRQDYPEKELIIVNDTPGQELICNAAGVTVVNLPRRFRSTGEKFNAAVGLSTGELLAPWDDDDVALPWRLSMSIERLRDADYYNSSGYWLLSHGRLRKDHQMALCWGGSILTRKGFNLVGGFPHISGEADQVLYQNLKTHPNVKIAKSSPLAAEEWYYIYRWGISPTHISSRRPYDEWYAEIGRKPVEQGRYILRPHWEQEYLSVTRNDLGHRDLDQVGVGMREHKSTSEA